MRHFNRLFDRALPRLALFGAIGLWPLQLCALPPQPVPGPFNKGDEQIPPAAGKVKPANPAKDAMQGVTITWFGQSCFAIQDKLGHLVLTDPFDPKIGYPLPRVKPTVITLSHEHPDHDYVQGYSNFPIMVRHTGDTAAGGLIFRGLLSWHDHEKGASRGPNRIYLWSEGGLKLAHLGDLGEPQLSAAQLTALRDVDVLFIPVGGHFTIDAEEAAQIVNRIRPAVVIPMHYKTAAVELPLAPIDAFLKSPFPVVRAEGASLALNRESLPKQTTVYVLDYVSHQGGPR